jgi:hypothetical protein
MRFSHAGVKLKLEILPGSLFMAINRNSSVDLFYDRNSSVQQYDELLCDGPDCEISLH